MKRKRVAVAAILLVVGIFANADVATASAEGDAARGKTVFNRCSVCHAATPDNKVGPHLFGIFGRKAGTVPGARYSSAMTTSQTVWNEETLDVFLAAPGKAMPGTTMGIGVPNSRDRADVIAYLKTLSPP